MNAWTLLQGDGGWIAIAVTAISLAAAFVMHRVIVRVLRSPPPEPADAGPPPSQE